eukprot:7282311-Pyramimonas_sp.AAC.1
MLSAFLTSPAWRCVLTFLRRVVPMLPVLCKAFRADEFRRERARGEGDDGEANGGGEFDAPGLQRTLQDNYWLACVSFALD